MKPEEQRIALAKLRGFTNINSTCWRGHLDGYERKIADYPNDLNAIHEIEMSLTEDQLSDYGGRLRGKDNETVSLWSPEHCEIAKVAIASASQRAEALLKTLNLWT